MTVQKLIETLQDFDPNMEVKFAYNFGDYWRSEVASSITELDEGQVTYSQYHRMDKVVISKYDDDDSDEDDDNGDDDIKTVVILR